MPYHTPHILVVDDDVLIRKALKLHLEVAGYQVSQASNGLEAVEAVEHCRPDIIILDIFMPEMDGFETLRRLNSRAARARSWRFPAADRWPIAISWAWRPSWAPTAC